MRNFKSKQEGIGGLHAKAWAGITISFCIGFFLRPQNWDMEDVSVHVFSFSIFYDDDGVIGFPMEAKACFFFFKVQLPLVSHKKNGENQESCVDTVTSRDE